MINALPATSFSVVLFCERGIQKNEATDVAALFERHPGPVNVTVSRKTVELPKAGDGETLRWDDIFAAIREFRESEHIPTDAYVCLLTKTDNENNWYAAQDEENMRSGFGHVGDFSWVTSASNYAISAHYVLKGIYNALVHEAGIDWQSLWHMKPRGCFFDFCAEKTDLNFKLRTADICGDCLEIFQSIGIPNTLLIQTVNIMEATRRQAINTGQFLPAEVVFNDWPFPVAITRHKAVQAINPLLRFMLLLDHFDSLVRYSYLVHEIAAGRIPASEDRPSLGWWVEQLGHSLKDSKDLREAFSIAVKENVVHLRNEKRGHGWMSMHVAAYQEDADRLEKVLDRIEAKLRPLLEKYRLVIPRQIQICDDGFCVEGETLVGSHHIHPPFKINLGRDLHSTGLTTQDVVYLTDSQMREFKSMSPYIRHDMCPSCHHPRVLITDGGNQYIDVSEGHRIQLGT